MHFWNSYPFIRLSIALIVGILISEQLPLLWDKVEITGTALFVIYIVLVIISHKFGFFKLRLLNGLFALVIISIIGGYLTLNKYHSHPSDHYTNIDFTVQGFSGIITSPVNVRTNHFRYDLELKAVVGELNMPVSGKIHLYVRKDSLTNDPLSYGDIVTVYGSFYRVPGPGNPAEFNYKGYLERQNIYSHAFIKAKDVQVVGQNPPSHLRTFAYSIRAKAIEIVDRNIPESRENAISKALLLGIKDFLDNDIKQAYASAGAMHVLAVSGLHVGIIYLILQFLLGKLRSFGNAGKYTFGIISIAIIWFYAMVTGLSPSVLRAATMFSMIAFGRAFAKDSSIYNTLGVAAFVLLTHNPYLIYSVGFQLSFAAVFGIVYLQPKLYRLINSRFWLIDKAWAITCVSIAAQLSTFPLSAYYFHQFPTYFLVSNLVVIPGAFVLLILGVTMLILDLVLPSIGFYLGRLLYHVMWTINEIIERVQTLPSSLIEWIYLDKAGLILTYVIIITFICGLHFRSLKTLVISVVFGFGLLVLNISSHQQQAAKHELVFYEIKNRVAIDHVQGHEATLYVDDLDKQDLELLAFQIEPYRLSSHLPRIKEKICDLDNKFIYHDVFRQGIVGSQKVMIIDSTTFHLELSKVIHTDILIIDNGSIKNLKWLNQHFNYNHLIIGNKNSGYYTDKIKKQADKLDVNVHSLKEEGAYVILL